MEGKVFSSEQLISDCRDCFKESDTKSAVKELITRTVSDPGQVMRVLGEPQRGGINTIYRADDLTILNLVWGPGMDLYPHDHRMWAVIGIYTGTEDNSFYQRSEEKGLSRHGMKHLNSNDTVALGETVIHSVRNPLSQCTAALHVYGGDFFAAHRSEWDPETYTEKPYDIENAKRMFELSNQALDERAAG